MEPYAPSSSIRRLGKLNSALRGKYADACCQDLSTRLAGVLSLRAFFDAVRDEGVRAEPASELLGIYLAVYDTLIDDDDEVRDLGALTVSSFLASAAFEPSNKSSLSLSPPAAQENLLDFFVNSYKNSTHLWMEAAHRLTGTDLIKLDLMQVRKHEEPNNRFSRSTLHLRPVSELFVSARTIQNAVFVEEKQNLYIDTAKEAERWAEVLYQIDNPTRDTGLALAFETWTVEGLTYLIDTLQSSTDGELGETSKPEVFTLITRVVLAAKVLMRCSSLVPSGEKDDVCAARLQKLLDIGIRASLHGLLLDLMRKVLALPQSRS